MILTVLLGAACLLVASLAFLGAVALVVRTRRVTDLDRVVAVLGDQGWERTSDEDGNVALVHRLGEPHAVTFTFYPTGSLCACVGGWPPAAEGEWFLAGGDGDDPEGELIEAEESC